MPKNLNSSTRTVSRAFRRSEHGATALRNAASRSADATRTAVTRTTAVTKTTAVRVHRRRFDIKRYLTGVAVCSIGAAFTIRSGLGAAPYDALVTGLSRVTGIAYGFSAWILLLVWASALLALGGRISLGQFVHGSLFGPIIGLSLFVLPEPTMLASQVLYLMTGIAGLAVGIHLFLGARILSGVLDTFFETVGSRFTVSPNSVRLVFDVFAVLGAIALGGAFGVGTFIVAASVAPLLKLLDRYGMSAVTVQSWRGIRLVSAPQSPESEPLHSQA